MISISSFMLLAHLTLVFFHNCLCDLHAQLKLHTAQGVLYVSKQLLLLCFNFVFISSWHLIMCKQGSSQKDRTTHSCNYQTHMTPAHDIKEGKPREEYVKADFYTSV